MSRIKIVALILGCCALLLAPVHACTVFVLTDSNRTQFFNNEDWSNPRTRLWFIPAGPGYFGAAYVGFDDGWAQGGVNTEGLAYDWVAGCEDKWQATPEMKTARGNSSQRMLESCSTVAEAIAFYEKHREPEFARARILIADRTGASAVIGYKDGKLHSVPMNRCRGFGYGRETVEQRLKSPPEPTIANGMKILRDCLQKGEFATRYSSAYDLTSGDLYISHLGKSEEVKLSLVSELKEGPHYYDIPELGQQLNAPAKPLLKEMKRFYLDEFKPIADEDPKTTERVRSLLQRSISGTMRAEDFTDGLWQELSGTQQQIRQDLENLGRFQSLTLVDREIEDDKRTYYYRVDFSKATVIQLFTFNDGNKLSASKTETIELKN